MRLRLRRWRGYEPMMIDSRVKSREQGFGGLMIGFYPGLYRVGDQLGQAVYVHENGFWLLEPALKQHSPRYARPYSHYGITAIYRKEWTGILQEWTALKSAADYATMPTQLGALCSIPRDVRKIFLSDFRRNCLRFSRMTSMISDWVESRLAEVDQITILGI